MLHEQRYVRTSPLPVSLSPSEEPESRRSACQHAQERALEEALICFQKFAHGSVAQRCAVADADGEQLAPLRLSVPRSEEQELISVHSQSAPEFALGSLVFHFGQGLLKKGTIAS